MPLSSSRTHRAAAVALACALVLAALCARAAVGSAPEGRGVNEARAFVVLCDFSHRNTDDPIVLPGRPGTSHDHTYVGNVSTDAFTTPKSLAGKQTTCHREADKAAYWAPTLFDDGKPLDPTRAVVYYRRLTTAPVRPYPEALTMVAGNSRAPRPQSPRVVFWDCAIVKTALYGPMRREAAPPSVFADESRPPACPPASKLQLHVAFPDCWNGRATDSFDHRRHMAYSAAGRCPRSHPVAVPAMSLVYQYTPPQGTVALSSGSVLTAHADFVNAWDRGTLERLVARCLNGRTPCGTGT